MVIVGITGNIGTGKSTVSGIFESLGAYVIDADKIAHRLLWRNSPCFKAICRALGKNILSRKQGSIDRKKLAEEVFNNAEKLSRLEGIIHPQVRKEVQRRLDKYRRTRGRKIIVLDIPLLFETGMDKITDVNITVFCNHINQMKRLLTKGGLNREDIQQRSRRQMPLEMKKRKSDFTINNNSCLESTRAQVLEIWNILNSQKFKRG